tara:strand:- start:88 stop:285 length:198 start_codon:yes stop_codon:yes gene_type:complete
MVKRYRVRYYTDNSSRVNEIILMAKDKIDAKNQLKEDMYDIADYVKVVDVFDVKANQTEVDNFFI